MTTVEIKRIFRLGIILATPFKEMSREAQDIVVETLWKQTELYAVQEAIKFKEWQDGNLENKIWQQYDGPDRWIDPHTKKVITTEQLYKIFKSDNT